MEEIRNRLGAHIQNVNVINHIIDIVEDRILESEEKAYQYGHETGYDQGYADGYSDGEYGAEVQV